MQMNTAEAGALFGIDGLTGVHIEVAENADIATVQSAIALAVPTAEVVDNETIRSDTEAEFTGQIDIIGNILLGFGGVALFVSIFNASANSPSSARLGLTRSRSDGQSSAKRSSSGRLPQPPDSSEASLSPRDLRRCSVQAAPRFLMHRSSSRLGRSSLL
jgi:hypothetical protein